MLDAFTFLLKFHLQNLESYASFYKQRAISQLPLCKASSPLYHYSIASGDLIMGCFLLAFYHKWSLPNNVHIVQVPTLGVLSGCRSYRQATQRKPDSSTVAKYMINSFRLPLIKNVLANKKSVTYI